MRRRARSSLATPVSRSVSACSSAVSATSGGTTKHRAERHPGAVRISDRPVRRRGDDRGRRRDGLRLGPSGARWPEPAHQRGRFQKLSDALAGSGLDVVRVPHEALHLDCCLAPLPNGEALYAAAWLPKSSVAALARHFKRLIPLNRDEATRHLAANIVWLDRRTVVSSTATKKTNALLRGKGYVVIELAFSDLVRQWGGFRCAVCPVQRDPINSSI